MTTIKNFTSLEQSRKLAEILPLESADMHYSKDFDGRWFVGLAEYTSVKIPKYVDKVEEHLLPCWSLASLLGVLPKIINNETLFIETSAALWHIGYRNIYTARADNPVDACYEMIIKLKELNLI